MMHERTITISDVLLQSTCFIIAIENRFVAQTLHYKRMVEVYIEN